ncbi:MAG: LUD domain-containing protein [Deltaproteobacteria bacterium]|nr:LUD domain-containing protein [Deltaproteobacteria bacterium]
MTSARDAILASLAATRPAFAPRTQRFEIPPMPADPVGVLRARVEAAGGRLDVVPPDDWVSRIEWPVELAAGTGPTDGPSIHSALPAVASRGSGRLAPGDAPFTALDLCVLRGEFAVVENGAVWHVPRHPLERRAALLAEHLVVVIEGDALVANLHRAYERIDLGALAFGWFLCGPSKTADIEQALVLGAHGPRSMRLVWLTDAATRATIEAAALPESKTSPTPATPRQVS